MITATLESHMAIVSTIGDHWSHKIERGQNLQTMAIFHVKKQAKVEEGSYMLSLSQLTRLGILREIVTSENKNKMREKVEQSPTPKRSWLYLKVIWLISTTDESSLCAACQDTN